MHTLNTVKRFTSYSKLSKFNITLLALLLIAGTMSVSFATSTGSYNDDCGARVALVLDRSSSIGVDRFSGSRSQSEANISAIKVGANIFVDSLIGKDSYTDVYAFAAVAQRINTGGWFNVKDQTNANWQKMVIGGIKFKQGATSSAEDAYNDGMNASGEGLTNWAGALNTVGSTRQDPFPTHLVIFTDGNPTTNQEEVNAAIAAGGSFTAAGIHNVDGVDADDISMAVNSANFLRALGIKIIPVAVGAEGIVNMANLQALAGSGNPVYRANDYSQLSSMFRQAAANICKEPKATTINVNAVDETGKLVPVPVNVGTAGTQGGPGSAGENKTTSQDANNPWSAKWSFTTEDNWRARITQTTVPAGYVAVSDKCARENITGAALPQREGTENSPSNVIMDPIMPGGNIFCQFVLRKLSDGIELIKDVTPTSAKRGESVTYSFKVKNTGNTKLTNIKIVDPMLGGEVGTVANLEVGATSSPVTKTYTIPNNATGTIRNVATATGTPVNPDGSTRPNVSDDDPADVVVELRQGREIEKTVTPSVASVGTEVTYTISVKNTGEGPISNVLVTDATLNKELTIPGPIAPGATGSVQVKYTIKAGDFKEGVFTNVACLKGTQTCDDAKVSEPKVELIKSGPESARPGEKVTYTFKVKNTGKVDLTNIRIVDETLSEYTNSAVIIDIDGTLKPGETSEEKKYEFTIPSTIQGNTFKNIAVVTANPIDPEADEPVTGVEVKDEDDHTIALIRWTATKTADKSVAVPGTTITYTITVTNTGGTTIKNLEVSDPTIGFPEDGKPVVITTLAVGESKSVTATYVIPEDFDGDTFKNTALVCVPTSSGSEGINAGAGTQNCQRPEAEVDIARISLKKTADKDTAFPGDKVVYTFVVENTGAVDIDPGVVNDDVLGEIGDPGVLKPGEKATFTKEYKVDDEAEDQDEVTNIATVCAPVPGRTEPTGQTGTATDGECETICPKDSLAVLCDQDTHTLVIAVPSITIEKTADKESANVGETVVYKFVVTNTSETTLSNITVTDNVLGDLGDIESLEPGESATKTVEYIVPAAAATAGTIVNVATACFATPEYDDNCASDDHTLTVVAVGGVTVTRPPAQAGLAYTGAQSAWLAIFAGLILALGTVLFVMAHRRKNESI